MHVVRARQNPTINKVGARTFSTGSGIGEVVTIKPQPRKVNVGQRSVPPSTRQFAKDVAAFYGAEGDITKQQIENARALKNSKASCDKPPSTRQFAKAYQAFYDVDSLNEAAMEQVRAIKNGTNLSSVEVPKSFRISTSVRQDPNFRANLARFHGTDVAPADEFYKDYRAFYGGATPNVYHASQMGKAHQEQQKSLLRNKLAETAKRILNTKSFDDGIRQIKNQASQPEVLQQSGFEAKQVVGEDEPASYQQHHSSAMAQFVYAKNPKIDKVTKTDPPVKNIGKMRYNIVTGSLQEWY